jgi:hypothetical protein
MFGVSRDRLNVSGNGGVVELFGSMDQLNRVVIVE